MSTAELEKKMYPKAANFRLVETLPPEAYREAHLPEAINLPPDQGRQLAPTLLPDKSAEIVTYCATVN